MSQRGIRSLGGPARRRLQRSCAQFPPRRPEIRVETRAGAVSACTVRDPARAGKAVPDCVPRLGLRSGTACGHGASPKAAAASVTAPAALSRATLCHGRASAGCRDAEAATRGSKTTTQAGVESSQGRGLGPLNRVCPKVCASKSGVCRDASPVSAWLQVRKRQRLLKRAGKLQSSDLLWLLRRRESGESPGQQTGGVRNDADNREEPERPTSGGGGET